MADIRERLVFQLQEGINSVRWGFFLGPDKAGSSWLHNFLTWHPQAAVPAAKELFYFDRYYHRGWDWYERQFPSGGHIRVEVCHDYLFSAKAAERIAQDIPDASLVVALRHPVYRAVSAHRYMVRQGRTSMGLVESLFAIPELLDHGRYFEHLAVWLHHIPLEQLQVLDFSELVSRPRAYAHSVSDAFGLDWHEVPDGVLLPVRQASRARWQFLATAGRRTSERLRDLKLQGFVGKLKGSGLVERLLFREVSSAGPLEEISGEVWARLEELLRPDAIRLDEVLGTDFERRWWDGI